MYRAMAGVTDSEASPGGPASGRAHSRRSKKQPNLRNAKIDGSPSIVDDATAGTTTGGRSCVIPDGPRKSRQQPTKPPSKRVGKTRKLVTRAEPSDDGPDDFAAKEEPVAAEKEFCQTAAGPGSVTQADEGGHRRSVGVITDADCLGPCEPGTHVNLDGIVWQETSNGVLVINVTWRGKTYMGTLLDATRHDWAPPRLQCESPGSDKGETRVSKSRIKRRPTLSMAFQDINERKLRRQCRGVSQTEAKALEAPGGSTPAAASRRRPKPRLAGDSADGEGERDSKAVPESREDHPAAKRRRQSSSYSSNADTGILAEQQHAAGYIPCPEPSCTRKYRQVSSLHQHRRQVHSQVEVAVDGGEGTDCSTARGTQCSALSAVESPDDSASSDSRKQRRPRSLAPVDHRKYSESVGVARCEQQGIKVDAVPVLGRVSDVISAVTAAGCSASASDAPDLSSEPLLLRSLHAGASNGSCASMDIEPLAAPAASPPAAAGMPVLAKSICLQPLPAHQLKEGTKDSNGCTVAVSLGGACPASNLPSELVSPSSGPWPNLDAELQGSSNVLLKCSVLSESSNARSVPSMAQPLGFFQPNDGSAAGAHGDGCKRKNRKAQDASRVHEHLQAKCQLHGASKDVAASSSKPAAVTTTNVPRNESTSDFSASAERADHDPFARTHVVYNPIKQEQDEVYSDVSDEAGQEEEAAARVAEASTAGKPKEDQRHRRTMGCTQFAYPVVAVSPRKADDNSDLAHCSSSSAASGNAKAVNAQSQGLPSISSKLPSSRSAVPEARRDAADSRRNAVDVAQRTGPSGNAGMLNDADRQALEAYYRQQQFGLPYYPWHGLPRMPYHDAAPFLQLMDWRSKAFERQSDDFYAPVGSAPAPVKSGFPNCLGWEEVAPNVAVPLDMHASRYEVLRESIELKNQMAYQISQRGSGHDSQAHLQQSHDTSKKSYDCVTSSLPSRCLDLQLSCTKRRAGSSSTSSVSPDRASLGALGARTPSSSPRSCTGGAPSLPVDNAATVRRPSGSLDGRYQCRGSTAVEDRLVAEVGYPRSSCADSVRFPSLVDAPAAAPSARQSSLSVVEDKPSARLSSSSSPYCIPSERDLSGADSSKVHQHKIHELGDVTPQQPEGNAARTAHVMQRPT